METGKTSEVPLQSKIIPYYYCERDFFEFVSLQSLQEASSPVNLSETLSGALLIDCGRSLEDRP